MKTEILSIGSELTSGLNLDTNARWLSSRLSEIGIPVDFHTTVGDSMQDNIDVFAHAAARANLVIATGGLGPTADDLTREVVAKLAGVELVFDDDSWNTISAMFEKRGRPIPERNRVQAYFPVGATPIPNPHGTAPGIWIEHNGTVIVCMPGVPAEMFPMFDDWVIPRLSERFGRGRAIVRRSIRTFGAGESAVEEKLGDLIKRGRVPEIGITASEATISLHVTGVAETPEKALAQIQPDLDFIERQLGDLIYGTGSDELNGVVARLLKEKNRTLSTAESCTGGLVGHLLTEIPGISSHYLGGVVSYSNEAKEKFLGVPHELLVAHGAVSPEVAGAMAAGCRERFGSDLGIGITGVAGPDGGSAEKPVGLVYVALAHAGGIETGKYNWPAGRSAVKLRSAKTALNLIRLHLLGLT